MRSWVCVIVFSVFGVGSVEAAQQVDLPLCKAGDGKTPVPRWEVTAMPVDVPAGEEARPFAYTVTAPPPAYHGLMGHLRVKLGNLDEQYCSALREELTQIKNSTGQPTPLVIEWLVDDNGPQDDVRSLDFYELPEFVEDGCWLDGVYQFVALGHSGVEADQYMLNLVPLEAIQKSGSFCRPVQEG
ncbi:MULTISPECIES: hypothetical protein [unclassified Pseudovibrio]|uniref:hypothetical protein n=1 Tax=unclassified Pseudovibrio TaxID=2627060 RepID=UPI0007AE46BE|nr:MULTISPECIES: hypothetical protein [unclassified Pseudovibrio]KZL15035.1 hypothetical protein PsAD37_04570 [Pseudovibrio sp. Ad37]KZL23051.1 hypothetical protein PsWM33_03236 [Pseudovibrio sp. WM33]